MTFPGPGFYTAHPLDNPQALATPPVTGPATRPRPTGKRPVDLYGDLILNSPDPQAMKVAFAVGLRAMDEFEEANPDLARNGRLSLDRMYLATVETYHRLVEEAAAS